ncbi:MAG: acyltransferase family protein [Novosphingobium sp.]
MEADRFITRPLSIALDALRFLSAFGVLTVHAAEIYGRADQMPFTLRLSHGCVIVFFVLSGLVISESATRRPMALREYALARTARIVPVALPAVLLAALGFALVKALAGPLPPGFAADGLRSILTSLAFLSQSPWLGAPTWGNPPYWSLCYEVWYYALFGAGLFLNGWKRVLALAPLALLAGFNVLLLFPLWLAGAWLNRSPWARSLTARQGITYLLGCAAMLQVIRLFDVKALFWLRPRVPFSLGMSEWVISDYLLGVVVVIALAALRPLAGLASAWLARHEAPIRWAAGFSFSLYLFHYPLLGLMERFGPALPAGAWWVLAPIAATLAACAGIAQLTERRTPALRRWLDRTLPSRTPQSPVSIAANPA